MSKPSVYRRCVGLLRQRFPTIRVFLYARRQQVLRYADKLRYFTGLGYRKADPRPSMFRQCVGLFRERFPTAFAFLRTNYLKVFWYFDAEIFRYRKAGTDARFQMSVLRKTGRIREPFLIDAGFVGPFGGVLTQVLTIYYFFQSKKDRYRAAAGFVHYQSDRGTCPVLLFGDQDSHIPDLAHIVAKLTERHPQYANAVAFVVPNGDVEAALKPLAGKAAFVNVQRFWLDQSIDVANHDLMKKLRALNWNARSRLEADRKAGEPRFDLFEAMYMDLHIELIMMLRLAYALRAAFDLGKTMIVVCQPMLTEQQGFYQDFLRPDVQREIVTLAGAGVSYPGLLYRLEAKPTPSEMISVARAGIVADATLQGADGAQDEDVPAKLADRDPRSVAVVADASPGSHFWSTLMNLAAAAKRNQYPMRILLERPVAAQTMRSAGFSAEDFFLVDPNSKEPGFAKAFAALLDELDAAMDDPQVAADPVLAALQRHVIERLTRPNTGFRSIGYNYRVCQQIRRWMIDGRFGSLAVIPHWGHLAWAASAVANSLRIPVASTPSVSVAGNSASIVGWNRLDMIGCYGLQCQEAFVSQGYSSDRLELTGSVTLDEILQVSRQEARSRLKAFGGMAATGRPIVLYATSGVNKNEREILANIVEFCRDPLAGACLVVRPHHSIGASFYEDAIAAVGGTEQEGLAAVVSEGNAQENIAAADVVITDFSTVGADAVLIERPLLAINTTGKPFPANDYADLGVAASATTLGEIGPALRRLINEGTFWPNARESLEAFTKAYNWGGDGKAGERFLAGLEQLAQRKERTA
jgi:hypothetical protein